MRLILLLLLLLLLLFNETANGFLPGGTDTTIRHNTQITHITQNNTPHSKHSTRNYTSSKGHTTQINTMETRFTTTKIIMTTIK
jgi:hypothetical protein